MSEPSKRFLSEFIREPLLHFLILGGVLFAIGLWLDRRQSETILVTGDIVAQQIEAREKFQGRQLTDRERANLVDELIEEEVLVREAYRAGLDRNDARIRQRMIDKVRFMLNEPLEEPTQEQLREYFQQHKDQYFTLESMTLVHAFFPPALAEQLQSRAPAILEQLRGGVDHRTLGERFGLGPELSERTRFDLMQLFGNESAAAIWSLPDGVWEGPFESTYGFHFVKIVTRHPPKQQAFESVVMYLHQDWLLTQQRELQRPKIAERMNKYRIVVEAGIDSNQ